MMIDKIFLSITNNLAKPEDVLNIFVITLNSTTVNLTKQNQEKIKDYLERYLKFESYNKKNMPQYAFCQSDKHLTEEEIKSKIKNND